MTDLLKKTLADLLGLFPAVSSVSVVPVGLTKYREGLYPLQPVDREAAAAVLDIVEPIGAHALERCGVRVVYCSDEFYLKAGRPLPPAPSASSSSTTPPALSASWSF